MPSKLSEKLASSRRQSSEEENTLGMDSDRARPGDIERTDANKAALSYYREVYLCCKTRDWEASVTSLFPRNSIWRSESPSSPEICGLQCDKYKDLRDDAHWSFPTTGCTAASRDVFARAMESSRKYCEQQQRSGASTPEQKQSPAHTRPQPLASTSNAAFLPPVDTRKIQEINCLLPSELHLEHSDDPSGCACESCLTRAGVCDLGPLEFIDPFGHIVEKRRPDAELAPADDSHPAKKSISIKSVASSIADSSPRHSRISKLVHRVSTLSLRSRRNTVESDSSTFKFTRNDSGYESGAYVSGHICAA